MRPLTPNELRLLLERGVEALDDWKPDVIVASLALEVSERRLAERELDSVIAPFVHFIACFDAKPISGLDDEFYTIHAGTEWEASLRRSDFRKLAAARPGRAEERG